MTAKRVLILLASVIGVMAIVAFVLVWHPTIAPAEPPARSSFNDAQLRHGEDLASLGFCSTCHTAGGGRPYAGGRPLPTPFGVIYATNITPDAETGIGRWSLEAFTRALRAGVDRQGRQLYPAFPYSHFTKLTDDDIGALYAFMMTREPVHATAPENKLGFPFNFRPLIAGWNLLFLREGPMAADTSKSAAWNRGRYLAEALSHCGACHTPRNALGAEEASNAYDGGEAEGWWSPPLNTTSPSPTAWTQESLFNYLRAWDFDHAGGAGPMRAVVTSLARVPDEDVRALATYFAAMLAGAPAAQPGRAEALMARAQKDPAAGMPGAAIYAGACAVCHDSGGQVPYTLRSLALHTAVQAPNSDDIVRAVVGGIKPPDGHPGPFMPPFAGTLDAKQIADLVAYVRARFSDKPAWTDVETQIHQVEAGTTP